MKEPSVLGRRIVERWNEKCPPGTKVRYWPVLRQGPGLQGATKTSAHFLGGHTPVVWIEGRADCIALSHVEPLEPLREAAAQPATSKAT